VAEVWILCGEELTVETIGAGTGDFKLESAKRSETSAWMAAARFCDGASHDFSRDASRFSGPM
jgi:hypothetical protein